MWRKILSEETRCPDIFKRNIVKKFGPTLELRETSLNQPTDDTKSCSQIQNYFEISFLLNTLDIWLEFQLDV